MFIKTFSKGNPLGHEKQYCNTAFLSSSKFCGFFSVRDIYATDCVRHLKACNVTGDQFMYILCCQFFTLYKLFFLLRVGLIYNMLDDLSFYQQFIIFLQMIAQMMLVFHLKALFFLRYSNLQFYLFFSKFYRFYGTDGIGITYKIKRRLACNFQKTTSTKLAKLQTTKMEFSELVTVGNKF